MIVFKVYIKEDHFDIKVVNIHILGKTEQTKNFMFQAADIKHLIELYNPVEFVLDTNGVGAGLMDQIVFPSITQTGVEYPAYCAFNDDKYSTRLYPNAVPLFYSMKDNDKLTQQMNKDVFLKLTSGHVSFLEREGIVKNKLMSTVKGQNMSLEQKALRMLPHEQTTRLLEEIANFRVKASLSPTDYKLEKINSGMLSDKFSAFKYGIARICEREREYYRNKRKQTSNRTLVFFN